MELEQVFSGPAASLAEVLDARERALLAGGGRCLISFTLNIPGPVKRFPLALRAVEEGLSALLRRLEREGCAVLAREREDGAAGYGVRLLLDADPGAVKALAVALEDAHPLGRLFDLDVLGPDGEKRSRGELGLPPRRCLLCGRPAPVCARSRAHPLEALQLETARMLCDYFLGLDAGGIAALATRAALYEVCATPKPGLVDRQNCGAHRDMDLFTFLDSSATLAPWFQSFARLGLECCDAPPREAFLRARAIGERAEEAMFAATGGVNTHKGLVFSLGTVCLALGMLRGRGERWDAEAVASLSAALAREALGDLEGLREDACRTHGERLYARRGLAGVRGEAAAGFPSVTGCGLPALRALLARGYSLNDAAAVTLAALVSRVEDTNLAARGGIEGQRWARDSMSALLEGLTRENWRQRLEEADRAFIARNLSPGGCADLLAITLMLHFAEEAGG